MSPHANGLPNGQQLKPDVPSVDIYAPGTAKVDDIVQSLVRAGGCVVRGFVTPEDISTIRSDISPYLDADLEWQGAFFDKKTRRAAGLVTKSQRYLDTVLNSPLFRGVCNEMLSVKSVHWTGQTPKENVSRPILNSTVAVRILPGAEAQGLHRDDMIHHNAGPTITSEQYTMGRDTSVGIFVAGNKTTKQNGTTRFVPGSHLQDLSTAPPKIEEGNVFYAEMEPGDAFIMLASCYHGGSANMTSDQERLMYIGHMCKGFLRFEENHMLAYPLDTVRKFPRDIQALLAYGIDEPFVGWVDFENPLDYILVGKEKTHDFY